MDKLGICREDAQFMHDFERRKFAHDLALIPTIMRLYHEDERLARRTLANNTDWWEEVARRRRLGIPLVDDADSPRPSQEDLRTSD